MVYIVIAVSLVSGLIIGWFARKTFDDDDDLLF